MKLFVWVVAGVLATGSPHAVRADDPPPAAPPPPDSSDDEPEADDPGAPGENEPAPVVPAPAPASPHHARMSTPPRPHLVRPRVEDDGDGRLEKKEDVVLGGKHFRIKTGRGAVHVWVPPDYDRETAGTVIYVHGYYT